MAAASAGRSGRRLLLVISGPGGVGKGTVVDRLLQRDPTLWLSRSWTTRAPRPGEPPDAYVFVEREAFMARVDAGAFIEWTEFPGNGRLYGTPTFDDDPGAGEFDTEAGVDGRDVVLEIELDGARQVKTRYPDAVLVLIVAPSTEHQRERLKRRGDDEDSVTRRVDLGAAEEALGRTLADHVVVNDDVDRAAEEVAGILDAHRNGRQRAHRS